MGKSKNSEHPNVKNINKKDPARENRGGWYSPSSVKEFGQMKVKQSKRKK